MVDTSSYGASTERSAGVRATVRPSRSTISVPRPCKSARIVATSARRGMFSSSTGSAESREAASRGKAAFFAALTRRPRGAGPRPR